MAIGQIPKNTKLSSLINFKVKVITNDGSSFIGNLKSFDKYMNVVLNDCEEFRITKKSQMELKKLKVKRDSMKDDMNVIDTKPITIKDELELIKEEKRLLGLCIIRGEQIISVTVEEAPNQSTLKPELRLTKGKGSAKPLATVKKPTVSSVVSSGRLSQPIKTSGGGITKPSRPGFGGGFRRS